MKKIKRIFVFLVTGLTAFIAFAANAATVFAEDETGGGATEPTFWEQVMNYLWLIILGVLLVAWFIFSSFRRKKQVKEGQDMLGSLRPGTFVMTQGGLIGKVVEVIVISPTEKHVVLETGGEGNKSQITYDIRAIGMVLSPDRLAPKGPVEEMAMPSDEEIQKRLDDIYAPAAKPEEGTTAGSAQTETPEAEDGKAGDSEKTE